MAEGMGLGAVGVGWGEGGFAIGVLDGCLLGLSLHLCSCCPSLWKRNPQCGQSLAAGYLILKLLVWFCAFTFATL